MKIVMLMTILSGGQWYTMDLPLKTYTGENAKVFCEEDVQVAMDNRRYTARGLEKTLRFSCSTGKGEE